MLLSGVCYCRVNVTVRCMLFYCVYYCHVYVTVMCMVLSCMSLSSVRYSYVYVPVQKHLDMIAFKCKCKCLKLFKCKYEGIYIIKMQMHVF